MLNRSTHWLMGTAALILLATLGGMGLAYGFWTDQLQVSGVVQTGNLDASWTGYSCTETEPEGQDIGSTVVTIDSADHSTIHFNIVNGYPGYSVKCTFDFLNTGTLPWVVNGNGISAGNLTGCTVTGSPTTGTKSIACNELTVTFKDNVHGEFVPQDGSSSQMVVQVNDGALELTDYQFSVHSCLSQWNHPMDYASCLTTLTSP